jgi:hypothetical protein
MSPHLVEVLRSDWTVEQPTGAVLGRKAVYDAAGGSSAAMTCLVTAVAAVPPFEQGLQGPPAIDRRGVHAFYWTSFTFPFNLNRRIRNNRITSSPPPR